MTRRRLALLALLLLRQSGPIGPRFQDDGRWRAPAAARACEDGPPGYPWWAFAGLGGLLALFVGWFLRRRASRA